MDVSTLSHAAISADQYIRLATLSLAFIAVLKCMVLSFGFAIVILGYRLLQQGIRGEFKFKSQLAGAKADLASASPGTFFVLLGIVLMGSALAIQYTIPIRQTVRARALPMVVAPPAALPEGDPFARAPNEHEDRP